MFALLSLVVCLAAQPVVCETVTPDYAYHDTGQPPTLVVGQFELGTRMDSYPRFFLLHFRVVTRL